ncbi:MAG TPA: hypothetical protein VM865_10155, partial [Acidobacteriaceae bacterium]|nr:hypothetical protein [Acidobacteriaceae bacterium]
MRFLPAFLWDTYRTLQQVKAAAGFREGAVLTDRSWTFWTMTVWDGPESMRGCMSTGAHKEAM